MGFVKWYATRKRCKRASFSLRCDINIEKKRVGTIKQLWYWSLRRVRAISKRSGERAAQSARHCRQGRPEKVKDRERWREFSSVYTMAQQEVERRPIGLPSS